MRARRCNLVGRLVTVLSLSLAVCPALSDDWPQWRGPHRDGISQEKGLLSEWPSDGPMLLWHAKDIGDGYSTPAVVGEQIYLVTNKGLDDESVLALNAKDGSEVWSKRLGKVGNPDQRPPYPGARSTPTVEGDVLYALSSDGDLAALELKDGKVRWQKSLRSDFGGKPGEWAYSESPLVDGETLVCTPGGKEATILALNKNTGEVIWKCATPEGDDAAYSSAIVLKFGGVKQYVQFLAKGLVGVDAKTGKVLWRYGKTADGSPANIPTPVAADGLVYSRAGRSGGGLVKLSGSDGEITANQVYFSPKLPTAIGGAVKVGDHLYGAGGKTLYCVDFASGDVKWSDKSIGPSSVCFADGRLYLHGEDGAVALVEATSDGYHEKGRFTPQGGPDRGRSKAWAYPVVANGRLYIRDLGSLWCYEVKK